jgi:DNA repair exonuclease SbcCD ATPase subunit
VAATVREAVAATASVPPTPNVEATVQAAVSATSASVPPTPNAEATVNAAVQATAQTESSIEATVEAAVQATVAAAPTPIPSEQYVTMSEEELEAAIDQAVAEAVAATQSASTATTQAASDDTLTQEELVLLETYAQYADEMIAYSEELVNTYYQLYADLATETVTALQGVEADLEELSQQTAAINDSLQEINATLAQGLDLAEETISQLQATAQATSDKAEELKAQAQTWAESLPEDRQKRADQALSTQPNMIPGDRTGALWSAFDYADGVRLALQDGKLTQPELANIAQLGANASAGLKKHGGPALQPLADQIDTITAQLARGQVPQGKANLGKFEASLGQRPAGRPPAPSMPSAPSLPSMPSHPGSGGSGGGGRVSPPSRR